MGFFLCNLGIYISPNEHLYIYSLLAMSTAPQLVSFSLYSLNKDHFRTGLSKCRISEESKII